jgi:hypothetical protein
LTHTANSFEITANLALFWLPGRRPDVSTAAKHGTGQRKGHVVDLRRAVIPATGKESRWSAGLKLTFRKIVSVCEQTVLL